MLKAIGVALRSVMFALLLLVGVVYVFAIVTSLNQKSKAQRSHAGTRSVSTAFCSTLDVGPSCFRRRLCQPSEFFTQLLDGQNADPGDVAYDFRTVAATWLLQRQEKSNAKAVCPCCSSLRELQNVGSPARQEKLQSLLRMLNPEESMNTLLLNGALPDQAGSQGHRPGTDRQC